MNRSLHTLRFFKTLPALLLALYIGTQLGMAGHLHAHDNLLPDCLQCQLDSGPAALTSNHFSPVYRAAASSAQDPILVEHSAAIYVLKARGPPALS